MIRISKNQVIALHSQLIRETGGIDGIRDDGLLEAALEAPFQGFANEQPYPSLQQKAARLGYGLIMNHAFIDGNKRIGTHVMLVFLALNGIELEYTQEELADMILSVAAGTTSFEEFARWIVSHQQ